MSPTTFTADGRVIEHEGDAPPAEALTPPAPAPATEDAPAAPRSPRARPSKAPKKTPAVKAAEHQRRTRLGKHKK